MILPQVPILLVYILKNQRSLRTREGDAPNVLVLVLQQRIPIEWQFAPTYAQTSFNLFTSSYIAIECKQWPRIRHTLTGMRVM